MGKEKLPSRKLSKGSRSRSHGRDSDKTQKNKGILKDKPKAKEEDNTGKTGGDNSTERNDDNKEPSKKLNGNQSSGSSSGESSPRMPRSPPPKLKRVKRNGGSSSDSGSSRDSSPEKDKWIDETERPKSKDLSNLKDQIDNVLKVVQNAEENRPKTPTSPQVSSALSPPLADKSTPGGVARSGSINMGTQTPKLKMKMDQFTFDSSSHSSSSSSLSENDAENGKKREAQSMYL